jgi:diguanylate cyclase (GGDEF)-like protein
MALRKGRFRPINPGMGLSCPEPSSCAAHGQHFSCSLSAVLIARVHAFGGDDAVRELLREAGSNRTPGYLTDITNWISYDEALALWAAGRKVTQHPRFAYSLGQEAGYRLSGSSVAALLRSLGSPEELYRQITMAAVKFTTVSRLTAIEVGPGFAEISATGTEGFPRSADHCAWTCGMLSTATVLFGIPPANVEHERCAALGAPECRYRVTWTAEQADCDGESPEQLDALRQQLDAMRERLHSVFSTASDLIAADDIHDVLARITDRAAVEIRAPRYLLAVRTGQGDAVHHHHRGFEEDEVDGIARRILTEHPASLPESWLVVPVKSIRRDYGRLLAMYDTGYRFFPQERELFEVYARYAASALDNATALMEAKARYDQSSALLKLARTLAIAGTSGEVARRLVDAVPDVVDCDRGAVYLWDPDRGMLVRRAITGEDDTDPDEEWTHVPQRGGPLERLLRDPRPEPMYVDAETGDPVVRPLLAETGVVATILVPLLMPEAFLGWLSVSVTHDRERLRPTADLFDRLSGVAAQGSTALQSGRLVDKITHQAMHDHLTGLANRLSFTDSLRNAIHGARKADERLTLFYLDLDGFKPINDTFGHELGDQVLAAVADRLRGCTRAVDKVARLGGDEFAVLIDGHASEADADAVAERLAKAFVQPLSVGGRKLRVGASIGRASFPADAATAEALVRYADEAMYAAKRRFYEATPALARRR